MATLPSLPPRRRAVPDTKVEMRRIDQEGARARALLALEWTLARDARARQTEKEALRPSAPAEPPQQTPWWDRLQHPADPEPFEDFDDDEEDDDEEDAEPEQPEAAPIHAGEIAKRLKGLSRQQLVRVAEAFCEATDSDDDTLRQRLLAYPEEWASDAADDAEHDPEAAREAGRQEALGFLAAEIDAVTIAPAADQGEEP